MVWIGCNLDIFSERGRTIMENDGIFEYVPDEEFVEVVDEIETGDALIEVETLLEQNVEIRTDYTES